MLETLTFILVIWLFGTVIGSLAGLGVLLLETSVSRDVGVPPEKDTVLMAHRMMVRSWRWPINLVKTFVRAYHNVKESR